MPALLFVLDVELAPHSLCRGGTILNGRSRSVRIIQVSD